MLSPKTRLAATVLALLCSAGCASGPRYDGQVYTGKGLRFRVGPPPSSWAPIEATGALLAYRDDGEGATVLVNGRCGSEADDAPLSALTNHLFMRFTERQVAEEEVIAFDGREAQRTLLTAKLDGVPKSFEAFVLKKNGCVYDMVLIAEPSRFEAARRPFEAYVQTFHTEAP